MVMMKIDKHKPFTDGRGSLFALDFSKVPFEPKRVFWITDFKKGTLRGDHAHFLSQQYFIVISGEVLVHMTADCEKINDKVLKPGHGVFIPAMHWSSFECYNCPLASVMVLASDEYDKNDYIRNYFLFKELVKK